MAGAYPCRPSSSYEWLARRAELAGFSIDRDSTTVQPGYIYFNKPEKRGEGEPEGQQKEEQNGQGQRLRSVLYEGILKITDHARFQETLVRGIGPAKAYGFGLLSIATAEA